MVYSVYLIITKRLNSYITYVGYTKNIEKRLILHNQSKGAKFTKGKTWKLIYKQSYSNKSLAMKEEYKLKKNFKYRNLLKKKYLLKYENSNTTTL